MPSFHNGSHNLPELKIIVLVTMFASQKKHVLRPKNLQFSFKPSNNAILIRCVGYKQFRLIETRTPLLFPKSHFPHKMI